MGTICSPEEENKQDVNTVDQAGQRRNPGVKRDDSVPSESRLDVDDDTMKEATTGLDVVHLHIETKATI